MDKIFKTQFVNLETNEIFTLPTSYTDRIEACVCGQNYCRDRQQEDGTALFFRVVVVEAEVKELHPICDYDEDDCDGECDCCGLCCEEDSEEPDFDELHLLEEARLTWKEFAKRFPEGSASRIFFEQLN